MSIKSDLASSSYGYSNFIMRPSKWYTASAVVGIVFASSVDTVLNSFKHNL